jgi:hypothetical protein
MLDAFIIEQLRRREEREGNQAEHRNRLELPLPMTYEAPANEPRASQRDEEDHDADRGVVVIDF